MVQRKGPDIGVRNSLSIKDQANKEKPTPSSQDEKKGKESAGMSQLKRRLKKARSIKRVAELGELDAHLGHNLQAEKKPPPATPKSDHGMTPAAKPNTPSKSSSKQQQNPGRASGTSAGGEWAPPPNYMKGTNSSDARKEQQRQVRFRPTSPPTPTTPFSAAAAEKYRTPYSNPLKAASTPTPPRTPAPAPSFAPPPPIRSMKKSSSLKKSAKMLSKKLSLKPIRSLMRKCSEALMFPNGSSSKFTPSKVLTLPNGSSSSSSKPTSSEGLMFPDVSTSKPSCSSTLKDSKFPKELELNPGGTQAEGTSVVKVCHFNYCSLNGHCHREPVPPLKRFVSMRRRSLKKQKTLKLRQLSVKRRVSGTKGLKRAKSKKGVSVEVSPAVEMADDGDNGFFIEIYDDPRGGNVDPHLSGGGDDEVEFQSTERAQVASEGQEGAIMNNHPFVGTHDINTYMGRDGNGEADTQSTIGAEESGQTLLKRKSMKLRQLSVRRRSWQKSLVRAKSRRRASSEVFLAVGLPDNSGDNFSAETYDVPRGRNAVPHLYDSSNKYEHSGEAKVVLTNSAVMDHEVTSSNAYRKNHLGGEANHQSAKGAEVSTEGQKSAEQRFTTRPDSYTELSFDDNFDMVSEASFSETEVIEQFLQYVEGTGQKDSPAKETILPSAHKDRKRWDWGWNPDRNMVIAPNNLQDEQDSNLVSDAPGTEREEMSEYTPDGTGVEKYYMLFDDLVGSMIEDLSIHSSSAPLMRDPSCEIDAGETLLHERNEAYFTMMDEIYCSFNSPGSQNTTSKEARDTRDKQMHEEFQEGNAEEVDKEKGEEWRNQLTHQESESRDAEVTPAATQGDDKRGLTTMENKGYTAEMSSEIQAADQVVVGTTIETQRIPDMAKDTEVAGTDSKISGCGEAAKALCSLDDHADCCPIEQLSESSFEGKKYEEDREEYEDSITTTTQQRKPAAADNYDKLARKAIEDSVEEVYIYNVLKGSEGPEIIRAITDAIADPNEGVQAPHSKFKSRYSMTKNKAVQYLDKLRSFHPRPPNFLPVEPDPEAEKVDLRHQEMNEKKDAEEWMIDNALQKVLRRLAPARKKVTLIVKAYEAVTLAPTSEHSFQQEDRNFAHRKSLQACS